MHRAIPRSPSCLLQAAPRPAQRQSLLELLPSCALFTGFELCRERIRLCTLIHAWCLLLNIWVSGDPMLPAAVGVRSLSWLHSIPLCDSIAPLHSSTVYGQHLPAMKNEAKLCFFCRAHTHISARYAPKSGTAGSCGMWVLTWRYISHQVSVGSVSCFKHYPW